MKRNLALLVLLPFIMSGCWLFDFFSSTPDNSQEVTNTNESSNGLPIKQPPEESFGLLTDVTGGSATADIYRTKENGQFVHKVVATLDDPAAGTFYEGWLVNAQGDNFSTGRLVKKSGVWFLEFRSDTDYSDYTKVVITLEPDDGDPAPATHILEGSF